ncbi:S-layer homology domain-containing protein [Paenibacillus sp. 2TAB19]|uniref:S-layer homology domain-containing protein n=1 Tax=Paenibacillus sp. 2TAB19 TaxID=3233003 RepID=UPI003F9DD68E
MDISFKITLTDKSGVKDIQAAFANGLPNGKARGAIVDFSIEIINTKTNETIGTADRFSQALTRVIPMPKNMSDMPEQWGAFRYNETSKKLEFVAAKKVQINGVWYAMISSYTNSIYVVADNAVSFTDVQKHWGKSFVELAAAKGLVAGIGGGQYAPNQSMTRAEFTAMLVRALGRGTAASSTAPYEDVKQSAWYFDGVAIAKEHGLLDFVEAEA